MTCLILKKHFTEITVLPASGISWDGLFLNFDAGFDAENLRSKTLELRLIANIAHNKRNSDTDNDHCFNGQLYKKTICNRKNKCLSDSFRSILNRFDTTITSWIGFNYVAFIVIAF
ncbi:hypothetical protein MP477_11875 [Chryseobacterium sp. WG23]|nr:hypothetical protein [Chryseobacterium sp. WG23]MCQ9635659.1 hypothetical protein [Chryseobacterium sp. WG23]